MHVVHVIRDLDSASGGPSRSMPSLACALARNDPEMSVTAVFQDRGNETTLDAFDPSPVHFQSVPGVSALGPIRVRARLAKIHERTPIDLVHLHGLWSPSVHFSARFARNNCIPYMITPRGMLSAWCLNNKSTRKRIAWWYYQQDDLERADCIHATSQDEAADIESTGLTAPIAMIPHGCDLPPRDQSTSKPDSRLAVCITRIHPVKGLSDVLDAWADVRPRGWQLVIAGPDSIGYADQLREQINRQQLNESVRLIDEVRGARKWDLMSSAELAVSGSHSENFGMSIAESLAAGTPVITTQATPWQTVEQHRCGWWIPVGRDGLAAAIKAATLSQPEDLRDMGRRGAKLIETEYSWDAVASRIACIYRWLLDRSGDLPQDIHIHNSHQSIPH